MLPINRFFPDAWSNYTASVATSNVFFVGDAYHVSWSLTSSSGTASRWTVQGSNEDGFTAAIDGSSWQDMQGVTVQGVYGVSTSSTPRWIRFQRTPSTSSSTIAFSYVLR